MGSLDRRLIGLLTVTPDAPAAGQNLMWENTESTRIQIVSIILTLQTDANVANRRLTIQALHGSNPFCNSPAPGNQAASLTWNYRFATCMLGIDDGTAISTLWGVLSADLYIDPGDHLATDIINIQATDALTDITIRFRQALPA